MINQDQILSFARWAGTSAAMWAVGKGYISSENVPLVVGVVISLATLCWGLYAHNPKNTVKAAERVLEPGEKIVVNSQAKADALAPRDAAGDPVHDKILSPSEDLSHVSQQPGVVAVVLKSAAAADANPSEKVIGPLGITPTVATKP